MEKPILLRTPYSAQTVGAVFESLEGLAEVQDIDVTKFNSGEYKARAPHIGDREVYVFHDPIIEGRYAPNDFVMLVNALDDSVRRGEPGRIIHVAPHIPYQRQDKEHEERESVTLKRVMRAFTDPDAPMRTTLLTFDMHSPATRDFAQCRVKELYASEVLLGPYRESNCVLVAPDANAGKRLEKVAKKFGSDALAIVYKTRPEEGVANSRGLMNAEYLRGRELAVTVDDMIDTGGSNAGAANLLRAQKKVVESDQDADIEIVAVATHGIFSYDMKKQTKAEDTLRKSGIKVVATDTIRRSPEYLESNNDWLTYVSVNPILTKAIRRCILRLSISDMFR